MKHKHTVSCILHSSLWFNNQVGINKLFFPDWFANAISTVADIVNLAGNVIDIESLKIKYHIRINILNYYTIKKLVNKFLEIHKKETTLK